MQLEVLVWWELQLFWVFSLKEDYSQQVRKTWFDYIRDQITYDSENNLSGGTSRFSEDNDIISFSLKMLIHAF